MAPKPQAEASSGESNILDDTSARLAKRLRLERLARNWSLDEMAERSGVSRAMVHRVETGRSSPTAALLGKFSGAFELSIPMLFREEGHGPEGRIARAQTRETWTDPKTGYVREQINAPGKVSLEEKAGPGVTRVTLPPGAKADYPKSAFTFLSQIVWILEGELSLQEGNELHFLRKDDCLTLGDPVEITFENQSAKPCVYVVMVS
jgi:transcriptional regulator with XRE-family HTH domain